MISYFTHRSLYSRRGTSAACLGAGVCVTAGRRSSSFIIGIRNLCRRFHDVDDKLEIDNTFFYNCMSNCRVVLSSYFKRQKWGFLFKTTESMLAVGLPGTVGECSPVYYDPAVYCLLRTPFRATIDCNVSMSHL